MGRTRDSVLTTLNVLSDFWSLCVQLQHWKHCLISKVSSRYCLTSSQPMLVTDPPPPPHITYLLVTYITVCALLAHQHVFWLGLPGFPPSNKDFYKIGFQRNWKLGIEQSEVLLGALPNFN